MRTVPLLGPPIDPNARGRDVEEVLAHRRNRGHLEAVLILRLLTVNGQAGLRITGATRTAILSMVLATRAAILRELLNMAHATRTAIRRGVLNMALAIRTAAVLHDMAPTIQATAILHEQHLNMALATRTAIRRGVLNLVLATQTAIRRGVLIMALATRTAVFRELLDMALAINRAMDLVVVAAVDPLRLTIINNNKTLASEVDPLCFFFFFLPPPPPRPSHPLFVPPLKNG